MKHVCQRQPKVSLNRTKSVQKLSGMAQQRNEINLNYRFIRDLITNLESNEGSSTIKNLHFEQEVSVKSSGDVCFTLADVIHVFVVR